MPEFLVKVIGERHALDLVAAPYRGSAPMLNDLFGNQIPAAIASVPELIEHHKAGKLRVVAVIGTARQPALPEVPTFRELGLAGFEDLPYYAFFAPAGTPQAEIDRFANALAKVIAQPEVRDKLVNWGLAVQFMPQPQIAQRERAYSAAWGADHQAQRVRAAVGSVACTTCAAVDHDPVPMEARINQIVGVVTNGLFAARAQTCCCSARPRACSVSTAADRPA